MSSIHKELADGRWNDLSLVEQLGNVGSEVERALRWREKGNDEYGTRAFDRALELLDLTLACPANRLRLREVARTREILVDFFWGENEYGTSGDSLRRYFLQFGMAARRLGWTPWGSDSLPAAGSPSSPGRATFPDRENRIR